MILNDLSINELMLRLAALVVIAIVHGFALAGIAALLGDRGPARDGRLSLSPFSHLDILGLLAGVVYRMGWIKPVAIDPAALRGGRLGLVACVLASLATVVVLGVLALQLRWLAVVLVDPAIAKHIVLWLNTLGTCAVWFALFNLLPLPPLTGGHLLAAIAPTTARWLEQRTLWISLALVVLLFLVGDAWFRPFVQAVANPLLG